MRNSPRLKGVNGLWRSPICSHLDWINLSITTAFFHVGKIRGMLLKEFSVGMAMSFIQLSRSLHRVEVVWHLNGRSAMSLKHTKRLVCFRDLPTQYRRTFHLVQQQTYLK